MQGVKKTAEMPNYHQDIICQYGEKIYPIVIVKVRGQAPFLPSEIGPSIPIPPKSAPCNNNT